MTENAATGNSKLYRFPKEGMSGISAGLAYKLKIQTWIVRVVWVLLGLFFGWPLLAYIALWILMPPAETPEDYGKVCK